MFHGCVDFVVLRLGHMSILQSKSEATNSRATLSGLTDCGSNDVVAVRLRLSVRLRDDRVPNVLSMSRREGLVVPFAEHLHS